MANMKDPLLDAFLFETKQLMEKAELILIQCEKAKAFDEDAINEIFRVMHTIKGSSAMMEFRCISDTAHAIEDLFFYIREHHPRIDYNIVSDIILNAIDFMKDSVTRIENSEKLPEEYSEFIHSIDIYLEKLKTGKSEYPNKSMAFEPEKSSKTSGIVPDKIASATENQEANFVIWIEFDDDSSMESLRAFSTIKQVEEFAIVVETRPADLSNFEQATESIRKNGFEIFIQTNYELHDIEKHIRDHTVYLKDFRVNALLKSAETVDEDKQSGEIDFNEANTKEKTQITANVKQNFISVNVAKLDKLMDIVGELVISEVMVTKNPEITKLKIRSFTKAANQLKKMTSELQDIVMSIRMVPIRSTFYSMQRIVRDMCRKLGKEVDLIISGEDTEVDKNIIEYISDPLMHLIRNSLDHGIEEPETRISLGKSASGRIFLSARNEGGDVWITLRDDGRGLNRNAIILKAKDSGLLTKDEKELTDKEVWSFILMPGFSTRQSISQFSGRGVGMDVVSKNIEQVGGRLNIESEEGKGALFAVKIPLTLAIIDGLEIAVGKSNYTIPITSIKEAFRPEISHIVSDIHGHEAIMLRGECIEIMRLHKEFEIETKVTKLEEGIFIIVQNELDSYGIFADKLVGEHQVVVKPVPRYMGKINGVSGCSVLGDGSISLILDIAGLMDRNKNIISGGL